MNLRAKNARRSRLRNSQTAYQVLEPKQLLAADFLITEFQASNDSTITNDNGNQRDWIEIYNAGTSAGNLVGYSLTDDASEIDKWTFPSVTLQPNDFLLVFADDDANPNTGSNLYSGFKLSASGEYLGLFDPSGNVVSQYDSVAGEYPAQQNDGSYGLAFSSGGNPALVRPVVEGFFVEPTPLAANAQQFSGVVEPVDISVEAGFYDSQFPVALSTATPGANIRLTFDGSTPTATNGFTYTGPFNVQSSLNLRAAAFKDGYISSPSETRTYLFLDDVLTQSNNEAPPPGWPSFWGSKDVDYGVDPDVIGIEGVQAVKDALLSIPSWSITTDLDNLFDLDTGIYSNATQDGREWERPASVELLNPDGSEGFQINAGLRVRGGFSRRDFNPKSSFRLFFRSEYGQQTLEYPIHGDEGVDEFRKIDLRTAQNYSWSSSNDARNNFVQDVLARYAQRDLGQPYTRSAWLHLYLNGQYWGLYQTQERAEANFAASYFGGDPDDYDVIKAQWTASNPTDGNLAAYHRLSDQAHARLPDGRTPAFADNAAYYKAQGLNPDGTVNPNYENLLDVDNLITYMMIVLAGGNLDAPISNFGNNEHVNNYYTIRNRNGNEGFKFFAHDSEHTLLNINENRNGPYNSPNFDNGNAYFNPQWLHQQLMANDEYRIRFADNVQEAFFNGGPLSAEAQIAKLDAEAAKIDQAIIGESLRWGDSKRNTPFLRSDWLNAISNIRNSYLPNRNAVLLNQFRNTVQRLKTGANSYNEVVAAPLFPDVDAPGYVVGGAPSLGGNIPAGSQVTPTSSEGTIWYTTDGSDPRLVGGGISENASSYNSTTSDLTVLPQNSNWRYNDTGTDQETAWRLPGFDDSSWSQGTGQLGYGDDDESTVVSFGSDGNDKHPTTYFRKQFFVPAGNVTSVRLRFQRDDGIVAYLNGNEVVRDNLPTGEITFNTTALNFISDENESAWNEVIIPASNLLLGSTNTLAVEMHQYSLTQGGQVSSSDLSFDAELIVSMATTGADPIVVNESTTFKARTLDSNGTWSALQVADFVVPTEPATSNNFRVTELMYNSRDTSVEFIEIQNITSGANATSIDLGGVKLTDGPSDTFEFDAIASLGPQEYGLLVNDIAAFTAEYPNVDPSIILGEFEGSLSNGGEEIRFEAADGQTLLEFTYNDSEPWPIAADGAGPSLQLVDPASTPADQLNKPYRWRSSWEFDGTPGAAGGATLGIVISEVLANSDSPQVLDSIELHNPTEQPINIGRWFLSDSKTNSTPYQIPSGTVLGAGEYLVFDESDFNPTPETPASNHFALSGSTGDDIYLYRLVQDASGLSLRFEAEAEFGATFAGETLGRLDDGSGRLVRQQQPTLGGPNQMGQAGPLIISEINYHPDDPNAAALAIDSTLKDDDLEFVEIYNPTGASINLANWRLRGDVDYDFTATTLAAGESLIVTSFAPTDTTKTNAFLAHYGTSNNNFAGPWTDGSLSNGYGIVSLRAPDSPSPALPAVVPHVIVDEVLFDDVTAAAGSDGGGSSLNRVAIARNGNDPAEWFADQPTPGTNNIPAVAPTVVSTLRDGGSQLRPDLWSTLIVTFSDEVTVSASALQLFNDTAAGEAVDLNGVGFTYDSTSHTATWNFLPLPRLDAGYYTITLDAGSIQGVTSGLTLGGGDYSANAYVAIPGDTDLDGDVDVLDDAFLLIENLGQSTGQTWADGDFNGDGAVDVLNDAFVLVENLGANVRPPLAAAVASFAFSATRSNPSTSNLKTTSETLPAQPLAFAYQVDDVDPSEQASHRTPDAAIPAAALDSSDASLALSGSSDASPPPQQPSKTGEQQTAAADVEDIDEFFAQDDTTLELTT